VATVAVIRIGLGRMVSVVFRTCEEKDIARFQHLAQHLYAEDPNLKGVCPDVTLTYRDLTAKPDKGRVAIIEVGGCVVGYAIMIFFWSNEYGGNLIEIDELYIDESAQGIGVGTKFFTWMRNTFPQSKGWTLQVSHTNLGAIKLYQRLGFKPSRNQHMIKVFDDPNFAGILEESAKAQL
jgi:GNAT superfamily N-acetyltransferase